MVSLSCRFLPSIFLVAFLPLSLPGQQKDAPSSQNVPCTQPTFSKIVNEPNMFNEQQEEWLGEILDEQVLKNYNKVEDPEGDYLQKMGEHMLAQLSPTGRKYSFYVIDYPVNNAFSLGGSRVYVTRQLIAFLQNEDEFAGLLGHEIGHIVTHQVAIDISRLFRKTLGVTQVSDRKDIFDKWNQLQDIWAKKHLDRDQERSEDEQQIADRIGLYAMTRAGYQPLRLADFFDRLTENKGKTGNFLTDIFGTTNPNSKRVRLLINKAAPMPQECLSPLSAGSSEHFLAWQKAVVGAGRLAGKEQVSGMVKKTTLKPPLRGSLGYLQFSPDGKYLLAQDESSVFVLSREPFTTLFRIEALEAAWAQFSPDSRSVVVYDAELRVQKWDIANRERTSVHAVSIPGQCLGLSVSSTGEVLACLKRHKDDLELDLLDVSNGSVFFTKSINWPTMLYNLGAVDHSGTLQMRLRPDFHIHFSPDSRYFLLGMTGTAVGYDLLEK